MNSRKKESLRWAPEAKTAIRLSTTVWEYYTSIFPAFQTFSSMLLHEHFCFAPVKPSTIAQDRKTLPFGTVIGGNSEKGLNSILEPSMGGKKLDCVGRESGRKGGLRRGPSDRGGGLFNLIHRTNLTCCYLARTYDQ